jgi:hypothetical protein
VSQAREERKRDTAPPNPGAFLLILHISAIYFYEIIVILFDAFQKRRDAPIGF